MSSLSEGAGPGDGGGLPGEDDRGAGAAAILRPKQIIAAGIFSCYPRLDHRTGLLAIDQGTCKAVRNIVVAAMGNSREYGDPTIYPAALPGVIAVGAVSGSGDVASFSSSGEHITLSAPGVGIDSTAPTYPLANLASYGNPPLAKLSGTSMAAPLVTGVIARMLAYRPSLTRPEVIDLMEQKLAGPWDFDRGHGILNAYALLAAL